MHGVSYDVTSPVELVTVTFTIDLIAARRGSFTMHTIFSGARVSVILPTPRRTRDTDKKKQRDEFHIHIATLDTHNPTIITID